jgi:ATP-dependent Lon protease
VGAHDGTTGLRQRRGIRRIIIPEQNQRDLEEIPENIKKGITFLQVETMEEVIEALF